MWIIFALLGAIFESFTVIYRKQSTTGIKEYRLVPILTIMSALPLTTSLAAHSLLTSNYSLSIQFITIVLISGLLNFLAIWSRYRAIKHGDVSQTEPLTMLLPAFLLISSWAMLSETPSILGVLGTILVVIGAIIINTSSPKVSIANLLQSLRTNHASLFMILTVAIWSITANLDKMATKQVSVFVYVWLLHISIVTFMMLVFRPKLHQLKRIMAQKSRFIIGAGILGTIALIFQILAVQTAFVAYAIAIRRLDIILVMFLSYKVLKEGSMKQRIAGMTIMLIGSIIISLT